MSPKLQLTSSSLAAARVRAVWLSTLGGMWSFSTAGLESYAFARWEPVIYDAMVVAAAIEYGDRILRRPPQGWARHIALRIPVHDPAAGARGLWRGGCRMPPNF